MKAYKTKVRSKTTSFESDENIPLPKKIIKEAKNQITSNAKGFGEEFFSQLLGTDSTYSNPDMQSNPDLTPAQIKKAASPVHEIFSMQKSKKTSYNENSEEKPRKTSKQENRPGISYHNEYYESITRFDNKFMHMETNEQNKQIRQIMAEIKKLISSTKALQTEFGQITVETAPVEPGKYYLNFFEWMILMIRQAKQKVEDSKSWLETMKGKNSKKMGYWGKAKKFGTSFSQNNERNVATSTG